MRAIKKLIRQTPIVGPSLSHLNRWLDAKKFDTSEDYWEERYRTGGNSGPGSYGRLAEFKARKINAIVAEKGIRTVAEFGCGDGNQLLLADYPSYVGFDVSETVLQSCRVKFKEKKNFSFRHASSYSGEKFDLSMSLDVIFHLVEDDVFHKYMANLFSASDKYVLIYSSDFDDSGEFGAHVKNRDFKRWVGKNAPEFVLESRISNPFPFNGDHEETSFCDLFLYKRA
ncbi:hypothetical protein SCH01S_25_00280 [Sphingomonas changbaiensis NBRC 104936]|uniref:Methyltransferase domain-containing protein n=1 Tax=Sphingomonas changbaiensis NBRC 104936 TaxID=1219043 RepID=A0A0E9MNH2_9SPHN|nr:class I SAM-dependent methyltransferase [Sphingomonas changbaiensis]GAO39048.1 hypothetical protein SCH01S_25_00280 [Sphingomonas changbaiensis NBRC 104936]